MRKALVLLAALGALVVATPAAAEARAVQPNDTSWYCPVC